LNEHRVLKRGEAEPEIRPGFRPLAAQL